MGAALKMHFVAGKRFQPTFYSISYGWAGAVLMCCVGVSGAGLLTTGPGPRKYSSITYPSFIISLPFRHFQKS